MAWNPSIIVCESSAYPRTEYLPAFWQEFHIGNVPVLYSTILHISHLPASSSLFILDVSLGIIGEVSHGGGCWELLVGGGAGGVEGI
jgi:hypothetical protein